MTKINKTIYYIFTILYMGLFSISILLSAYHLCTQVHYSKLVKQISQNEYLSTFNFNALSNSVLHKKIKATKRITIISKNKNFKKITGIIFYLLSILLVSSKNAVLLVLILTAGMYVLYDKTRKKRRTKIQININYFRDWRSKFITPRDKCLQNRADEYDINPLMRVVREFPRILSMRNIRSAGFFMHLVA